MTLEALFLLSKTISKNERGTEESDILPIWSYNGISNGMRALFRIKDTDIYYEVVHFPLSREISFRCFEQLDSGRYERVENTIRRIYTP